VRAELQVRQQLVAGAQSLEVDIRLKNEGSDAWYLVWYDTRTAYIDAPRRALFYVEDLNRDPELLGCGGANMFVAPNYKKLQAGSILTLRSQLQISSPRLSVADTSKQVGKPAVRPTLSAGAWTLSGRFALLAESTPPSDLSGIPLCEYLSKNERHIETFLEIVVEADR